MAAAGPRSEIHNAHNSLMAWSDSVRVDKRVISRRLRSCAMAVRGGGGMDWAILDMSRVLVVRISRRGGGSLFLWLLLELLVLTLLSDEVLLGLVVASSSSSEDFMYMLDDDDADDDADGEDLDLDDLLLFVLVLLTFALK